MLLLSSLRTTLLLTFLAASVCFAENGQNDCVPTEYPADANQTVNDLAHKKGDLPNKFTTPWGSSVHFDNDFLCANAIDMGGKYNIFEVKGNNGKVFSFALNSNDNCCISHKHSKLDKSGIKSARLTGVEDYPKPPKARRMVSFTS